MAVQEGMYMTFENKQSIYDAINKLRIQNDALILAHLYENLDIQNIADFCGDSFELAKRAKDSERKNIIFCGVKFMAESAKILNPDKHVFIPRKDAGCAMADMVTPDDVIKLKEAHPNACAVCYINSSAATKAECDMCVTSSNALDIISALPQKEIIFVPDKNLGAYIAEKKSSRRTCFSTSGMRKGSSRAVRFCRKYFSYNKIRSFIFFKVFYHRNRKSCM